MTRSVFDDSDGCLANFDALIAGQLEPPAPPARRPILELLPPPPLVMVPAPPPPPLPDDAAADRPDILRASLDRDGTQEMKRWIIANRTDPYPTYAQRMQWARQFGMTLTQVNTFMSNARSRVLKQLKDQKPAYKAVPRFVNGVHVWVLVDN
jgi:hypothetical protein